MEISRLLKPEDQAKSHSKASPNGQLRTAPADLGLAITGASTQGPCEKPAAAESPPKKQKWSLEEDTKIIKLRGTGMKWEKISKHLPGRSAISCRLHYQNYLEKRGEWNEDRKNKLARLYERCKADMWSEIAEGMSIPWRAAEAMHWQLGEQEMARRAGVMPFEFAPSTNLPVIFVPTLVTGSHMPGGTMSAAPPPPPPPPRNDYEPTALATSPLPQLPSVAEITSGMSTYDTRPPPMHYLRTSPSRRRHHSTTSKR